MPHPTISAPPHGAAPGPADPSRVWLRFVRLQQRLSTAMAARLREVGLSIPQFDLMSTLSEREGATQQELAQRLYVTKGNVSGLVDRLVEAGLVERRTTMRDRRSHALHLTAKGHDLVAEGLKVQDRYVSQTLGRLPETDIAELERIVLAWRDAARRMEQP